MRGIHYLLIAIAIAAAILLGIMAREVRAQSSMCGPYKEFVKAIEGSQYGESSIGKGASGGGQAVVELFVGKETFTVLVTWPESGRTCIIAAGKMWVAAKPTVPGDDL